MAISSPLNPGVIAPTRRTTPERAQNFISGGAPLGSSVVASAANKIVGFQRGAAAVAPQAPDLGSIIKTLSTSILSNVENRIQSINQNVNQFVTEKITNLGDSFRKKVDTLDTSAPEKLLSNFLKLYESAIGYIRFFGNPSNVKQLGKNLNSLQQVFAETFEVATKIRQTIVRIVNQLSNLPTASAGGSGLNIDVDVPGGGLRRSAPSGLMRMMRRRPGMMLGGAALAGGGAALATSALAKVGQDVSGESMQSDVGLTGPVLDRFYSILTRFDQAIQNFSTASREQTKPVTSSTGSSSTATPTTPPPDDTGGTTGGNYGSAGAQAVKNFGASKGYSPEFTAGLLATVEKESGFNPYAIGDSGNSYGLFQFNEAGGRRQPFLNFLEQSGIKNPKELFLNPNSERAKKEKDKVFNLTLEYMMQKEQGAQIARDYSKSKDLRTIMGGFEDIERYSGSQPGLARNKRNNPKYNERLQTAQGYLKSGVAGTAVAVTATPTTAKPLTDSSDLVRGQPTSQTTTPAATQQISQPVIPIQSQPNVTVMPMQQGGGSQGNTRVVGGGGGNRETVPFLMARNDDNFLTMYSKIVYNIVDG